MNTKFRKIIKYIKQFANRFKLVTSVELDGLVVRAWFSDVDYVNKGYDTEKDAKETYEQMVKEFKVYKFI